MRNPFNGISLLLEYLDVSRLKYFKKTIDFFICFWYNIITVREGKPNKTRKEKNMRVTTLIRGYIEERVKERVYARYENEKNEAKRQQKIFEDIQDTAVEAATRIYVDTIRKLSAEHPFIEVAGDIEKRVSVTGGYRASYIKDRQNIASVHQWKERANQEAKEEAKKIMVKCELGGTKVDLDKLIESV